LNIFAAKIFATDALVWEAMSLSAVVFAALTHDEMLAADAITPAAPSARLLSSASSAAAAVALAPKPSARALIAEASATAVPI
jgi:hypothetical protein